MTHVARRNGVPFASQGPGLRGNIRFGHLQWQAALRLEVLPRRCQHQVEYDVASHLAELGLRMTTRHPMHLPNT